MYDWTQDLTTTEEEKKDVVPSDELICIPLNQNSEVLITTNVSTPTRILGVAKGKIRASRSDPWRESYICLYEAAGRRNKVEVNKSLYDALGLVFKTIQDIDDDDTCLLPV